VGGGVGLDLISRWGVGEDGGVVLCSGRGREGVGACIF